MIAALTHAINEHHQPGRLRAALIDAEGPHFSFGASVEEHLPDRIGTVLPALHALVRELLAVPAPTGAVVRGLCLGGGFEIALACDLVFAADGARLGVPEIALGVFPPVASALLPVKVGAARAAEVVLTGEQIPAARWMEMGLVTLLAPAASLEDEIDRWFEAHLAPRSAVALRHAAWATRAAARDAAQTRLGELERQYLERLMRTHDAVEGVKAFTEKRPPQWRNA
jgi:cyclohexa-1,5-dienecarbonyl-CoA hydratase